MRAALIVIIAGLAGCAGPLDRVRELRANAPDWYEARRTEIAGEGYGNIRDIPRISEDARPGKVLPMTRSETLLALARFEGTDRIALPQETAEEMRAWVADVRKVFDENVPEPDFLTDEDVIELKARFDVPRAQL